MAIYVTSDLHGIALSRLQTLLRRAKFTQDDFLFVLGDVIDRGEHGIELLKWLMDQQNAELILGNHEAMLLSCRFLFEELTEENAEQMTQENMDLLSNWIFNGAKPTLNALQQLPSEEWAYILEYLDEAPLYERVEAGGREFLLCHAGFENFRKEKPLQAYTQEEWLWSRPERDAVFFEQLTPSSF